MTNREVDFLYSNILKHIQKNIGNRTTFLSTLDNIGKKLLNTKFKGIFASDQIPVLTDKRPYCVLNLDTSQQSGSHWIGVAKYPKKDKYLVYDSFGRKTSKIIPSLLNKFGSGSIVDTEYDKEQDINEYNCGQRSLAFLILCDLFGMEYGEKL